MQRRKKVLFREGSSQPRLHLREAAGVALGPLGLAGSGGLFFAYRRTLSEMISVALFSLRDCWGGRVLRMAYLGEFATVRTAFFPVVLCGR